MFERWTKRGRECGTALPAVLSLVIGVAGIATAYQMRTVRAFDRERFDDDALNAHYQAWAQIELVTHMLRRSGYDADGRNEALRTALERTADPDSGEFIGPDGWPTGVTVHATTDDAGTHLGTFELRSVATFGNASRKVRRLFAEQSSFAAYNYFSNEGTLGIVGGEDAAFPFEDAPIGAIHSNAGIRFFLPDRHFRDSVSATTGFEFVAGARGPTDPDGQNTYLHGPSNDAADVVSGLTDVDIDAIGMRADTLISLTGEHDFAKVLLDGDRVVVEHWMRGRFEPTQAVAQVASETETAARYAARLVEQRPDPRAVWVELHIPPTRHVQGGGRFEPILEEEGTNGEWVMQLGRPDRRAGRTSNAAAPALNRRLLPQTPLFTVQQVEAATVGIDALDHMALRLPTTLPPGLLATSVPAVEEVLDRWIPASRVATHVFESPRGTIHCSGDIYLDPVEDGTSRYDRHVLDGALTLASGDDIYIGDSIVYGREDADGVLQTAYLDGDTTDAPYRPNPDYHGDSVLGLIARDRIQLQPTMPEHAEINASMLSRESQIQVGGLRVDAGGIVVETDLDPFVKQSLRRLGSIITNRRPVIAYIDENNEVTRGFVHGKSVYDQRQRMRPPPAFPTVLSPKFHGSVVGGDL